jgi:hypothetical protein
MYYNGLILILYSSVLFVGVSSRNVNNLQFVDTYNNSFIKTIFQIKTFRSIRQLSLSISGYTS